MSSLQRRLVAGRVPPVAPPLQPRPGLRRVIVRDLAATGIDGARLRLTADLLVHEGATPDGGDDIAAVLDYEAVVLALRRYAARPLSTTAMCAAACAECLGLPGVAEVQVDVCRTRPCGAAEAAEAAAVRRTAASCAATGGSSRA